MLSQLPFGKQGSNAVVPDIVNGFLLTPIMQYFLLSFYYSFSKGVIFKVVINLWLIISVGSKRTLSTPRNYLRKLLYEMYVGSLYVNKVKG